MVKKFDKDEYESQRDVSCRMFCCCIICGHVAESPEDMKTHFFKKHFKDFYVEEEEIL
jgi:hypothetical protein